jgi:hypothetical protein
MTVERMIEIFKDDSSYVYNPSVRRDLQALNLLNLLVPSTDGGSIIAAAEHDEIWLDIDLDKLSNSATEDNIMFLRDAGVGYDSDTESLYMFV